MTEKTLTKKIIDLALVGDIPFSNFVYETPFSRLNTDASRAHARLPQPEVRAVFDPYEFHVARYLNERASIEHRNESGQWLLDNGFIGCNGKMIVIREISE